MNLQAIHIVSVIFIALGTGMAPLANKFPPVAAPWIIGIGSVFTLLGGILALFSPQPQAKDGKSAPTVPPLPVLLALLLLLVAPLVGCPKCPSTPPPSAPQASAIVLRVDDAVSTTETALSAKAAKPSAKLDAVRAHVIKLKASPASFWCEAKALYDELAALEGEVVAAGLPVPAQLTEAIQLVQWAVDRELCYCAVAN